MVMGFGQLWQKVRNKYGNGLGKIIEWVKDKYGNGLRISMVLG